MADSTPLSFLGQCDTCGEPAVAAQDGGIPPETSRWCASCYPGELPTVMWLEDELVPATEEEMRRGLKEAMAMYADLLPKDDDCQCVTCRNFRRWMAG